MIRLGNLDFKEVWLVDFEFKAAAGEQQIPVCMVAMELNSGNKLRIWQDELYKMRRPPYSINKNSLVIAYYASAEMGCHLSLDWPMPVNLLDLYTEFRNLTNGHTLACGNGLLGALVWFGLSSIDAAEKNSMRDLILRGGHWSPEEKDAILDYCESDVKALTRLLTLMADKLDMPRALLRGRFMKAAAQVEFCGVPIDTENLSQLRPNWNQIQSSLIAKIDLNFGVYEGRTFKEIKFANWLKEKNIPWPKLESGKLDLKDETFREMARSYPEVEQLRQLRVALAQMRLSELAVGEDGRNRCLISAFRSRTGRNQPSNTKFIFGPAVWLRGLIRPGRECGLAYIDWGQQEFGIAAALSNDPLMIAAYNSGDPYLTFAKQAGAVPANATKISHEAKRDQFKACALAVQYGMGAKSLAARIGQPEINARELLRLHRETYKEFWTWSDSVVDYAMLYGKLWTVFGWTIHTGTNSNSRSFRNFPMQANGAEMLRLAFCFATERGIRVCAPIHDALLIEAPLSDLDRAIALTQEAMAHASAAVLDGFILRTDVKTIRYPNRYSDKRGEEMWNTVNNILSEVEGISTTIGVNLKGVPVAN